MIRDLHMFDIVVVCIKGPFRKHNKRSQTQCHRFILTPHLEPTAAVKKKKKDEGACTECLRWVTPKAVNWFY